MSFEVKCDVEGCERREVLVPGAPSPVFLSAGPGAGPRGLPPGWRIVEYVEQQPRRAPVGKKDPAELAVAMAKQAGLPSEFAELCGGLLDEAVKREPPFVERCRQRHVCPEHEMPVFEDDA